jgi:hypothetical protein
MATLIQIKRSLNTAVVPSLANGEMSFTANGDILSIGSNAGIVHIGGKRNPGILTANQALTANATSGIDKIIAANGVFTKIAANSALGGAGQILASNSTGGVYWMDGGAISVNTDYQYTWSNTQTFSNTITFSSTINGSINGNANNTTYVNGKTEGNLNVNSATSATSANNSAYLGGDAAANFVQNTDSRTLSGNLYMTGANTGFSTGYFVGGQPGAAAASVSANTTAILIGNTTVSATVNSTAFSGTANNSSNLNGKSEANLNVNNALTANAATYLNGKLEAGLNVNSATSATNANNAAYLGGTIASSYATQTYVTTQGYITSAALSGYATETYADNKAGNAYSNALSYTLSRDGSYTGNNTFGGTTTTINSNAALTGSVSLGDATSDVISFNGRVNTHIVPSANISYDLGTTLLRYATVHASNVASVDGNFTGDVSVGGNLTVSGTLTTIDTVNIKVKDPIIELADNNNTSDTIDIGFYGRSGNATATFFHGLVRDHATTPSVSSSYFRLFSTNTAPTTTVDTAAAGYNQGTLFAYLNSGALVSNATALNITANSSLAVALVANTLSLSTALPATSGGTGQASYTSGDLLVANTGNSLSKLALGSDGYVLQVSSGSLVYSTLDGGTF